MQANQRVRSTTVIAVIREGQIAMVSDGQVTVGNAVVKQGAQKVRKTATHAVLMGFAGGVADALALTARLEDADRMVEACERRGVLFSGGNLQRAMNEVQEVAGRITR